MARLTPDATLQVRLEPGAVASDDAVWLPGRVTGSLVRIEAKGNVVGTPVAVGAQPCASLVVAFDSVWVPLCGDQAMARLDPKAAKVTATSKVGVASADGRIADQRRQHLGDHRSQGGALTASIRTRISRSRRSMLRPARRRSWPVPTLFGSRARTADA